MTDDLTITRSRDERAKVGPITSRCSANEPALRPQTRGGREIGGNRAYG